MITNRIERIDTVSLVTEKLREIILNNEISPNMKLDPDDISIKFGVSKMPVREAIRNLEGEELVYSISHKGWFVSPMSYQAIREITDIRELNEGYATRRAVLNIDDECMKKLSALLDNMDACQEDMTKFSKIHREFHFTIYENARMPILMKTLEKFWNQSERYRRSAFSKRIDPAKAEHERILEAIAEKNADKAEELMKQHLEGTIKRIVIP